MLHNKARTPTLGSFTAYLCFILFGFSVSAGASDISYWMKIKANNRYERTALAEMGIPIEVVREDYVIAYGDEADLKNLKSKKLLIAHSPLMKETDFPPADGLYHNYSEVTSELNSLAAANPDIIALDSLGQTTEGREIWHLRISTDLGSSRQKPAVIYLGGHHAREHLSIEVPLLLTQKLISLYRSGDTRVVRLIQSREIHVVPMVNPDGAEYDIQTGNYKMWRKNRSINSDGSNGVDLNRNYGFHWGTGGSSANPRADTYMGPSAFSEPETKAMKAFIDQQENATLLLTYHTFSELILYPWGHRFEPISEARDLSVFRTMAQKMSQWNQYTPQQSSELYQASGDTTDWAYGEHRIFAFTFELDPKFGGSSWGFYPGVDVIKTVVEKNWEPYLFMMEYADNPYRVTEGRSLYNY